MRLKSFLTMIITSYVLSACVNLDEFNSINRNYEGDKYADSFSNTTKINININSTISNAFYSIYYEYPYNDKGDLTATCSLQGTTPIRTTLTVPKSVNTLYILSNNEIKTYNVSDITINDTSRNIVTRSTSDKKFTQEVLDLINNKYFPEKCNNVRGEDLYKCTDISVSDASSEKKFNEAEIWLTYVGDGNFSKSNMYGKIWFYTYPSDKYKTIKVSDCTFYGYDSNDNIITIPYSSISSANSDTENSNPIFWSKTENYNVNKGNRKRIKLGCFPKGCNIGFVFKGSGEREQFTTPALNLSADTHNYINTTINYKDKSDKFLIEKPVGNGFICHVKTNDFEGNVIGMENRTPNHCSYDGDYNDMLCLIETNPIDLKPQDEISMDDIGSFTSRSGLLLFEDNYPYKGDFDFNDVVIKYTIKDYYKTNNYRKDITSTIVAKGCNYSNEFGFYNDIDYTPIFNNISGYDNVYDKDINLDNIESKTITIYGENIKPYLNNGKGYILNTTYNTDKFPYVLDIPITNDNKMFRWCLESKSIEDAYNFEAPRAKDWYVNPKDEDLVIK